MHIIYIFLSIPDPGVDQSSKGFRILNYLPDMNPKQKSIRFGSGFIKPNYKFHIIQLELLFQIVQLLFCWNIYTYFQSRVILKHHFSSRDERTLSTARFWIGSERIRIWKIKPYRNANPNNIGAVPQHWFWGQFLWVLTGNNLISLYASDSL